MKKQNKVFINNIEFSNKSKLVLIAGPCAIESKSHAIEMAAKIREICNQVDINFIYKSSFDKANRTSILSQRGVGIDLAKEIFTEIKKLFNVPIITDVHENQQCAEISDVIDVIQIPAFLCRQTNLLEAASKTKKPIMVKKGQFMSPWETENIIKKLVECGSDNILLCERGVSFGYNNLVSDMKSIPIMQKFGWPIVFDVTHSLQQPGGRGDKSGGQSEFIPNLARAATAVGVSSVFIETHDNPEKAISDGPNMLNLTDLKFLLENLLEIDNIVKKNV